MEKQKKNKKITIDGLAIMMAKGFETLEKKIDKDIGEVKKDLSEVKENVRHIKGNILNLGDRFVSYHAFDSLSNRVKIIEEKKK